MIQLKKNNYAIFILLSKIEKYRKRNLKIYKDLCFFFDAASLFDESVVDANLAEII